MEALSSTVIGGPQMQLPYIHGQPRYGSPPQPSPPMPNIGILDPNFMPPLPGGGPTVVAGGGGSTSGSAGSGICPPGTVSSSQGCLAACPAGQILDPGGSNTCVAPASSQGGSSGGSTAVNVTTSSTTGSSNGPGAPPCSMMPVPSAPGSTCANPDGSIAMIGPDGASQVTPGANGQTTIYTPPMAPTSGITLFGYNFSPLQIGLGLGALALGGLYLHKRKRKAA